MTALTYSVHPTPIGETLIAQTADGIVTVHPVHGSVDDELERLSLALHTLPERDDKAAAPIAHQLDEYFAGKRQEFDVALDWQLVRGFTRDALEAIRTIPYGETAAYGEVAVLAGTPRAARAVGTACATTPFSVVVPVHRVIRSDGSIGEYGGHPEVKRFLLDLEQGTGE